MNVFDREILIFINQFAQRSCTFDQVIQVIAGNNLIKAVPLMTLVWWTWFKQQETDNENRQRILTTLVLSVVAILVSRILSDALPVRIRPISDPSFGFRAPCGAYPHDYTGWSSFPSDHAVLFFFLSAGLLFVSRPAGIIALIHTTIVICLPRLYMGYHYPTDIIAGAGIGAGIAAIGRMRTVSFRIALPPMLMLRKNPALFYTIMFLVTYQIADLFNDVRRISSGIYQYVVLRGNW